MNVNQLRESNFLKKEDAGGGILCTIKGLSQENVAKMGADPEMKYAIHFDEYEKPMILNSTNAQLIAKITGSDETEDWPGHKIVLYNDPSVSYGGKVIGGIRVRAPKGRAAQPQTNPATRAAAPPPAVTRAIAGNTPSPAVDDGVAQDDQDSVPF